MRWLWVLVVMAGTAHADPDADFAACKARRRALTREAMKITDMIERGRKLAVMPICRRFEDRSVEVVGPPAPPPPPPRLSEVRAQVGLAVGMGAWQVGTSMALPANTSAPFVELEAGGRLRGLALVAFGGYARLDTQFDYFDAVAFRRSHYIARDTLADGGVKLRLSTGGLGLGIGVGIEQEHETGMSATAGPRDEMHQLALVEGEVGYRVAERDGFAVKLLAIGSGSLGNGGAIASARLALGLEK
jgi:hypothetical protein